MLRIVRKTTAVIDSPRFAPGEADSADSRTRPFLKVQDGCDSFCAYCIVPYVRGPQVSRPIDEVVAEAKRVIDEGAREIVLLGQNVNSYGQDLDGRPDFAQLLEKIDALAMQSPATLLLLRVIEIGLPIVLCLVTLWLLRLYPLSEQRAYEIKELLEKRKAEAS